MRRVPALVVLFLISYFPVLRAQSTNASLTGRITDPSKGLIADAKVAAISTGTNVRYETTTNTSGEYYLTNLPPGLYQIEIEKARVQEGDQARCDSACSGCSRNRLRDDRWLRVGEHHGGRWGPPGGYRVRDGQHGG